MKIIKRNGAEAVFDIEKIVAAVTAANAAVDTLLADNSDISPSAVSEQMRRTADAFAVDMLVMKFIQGMPVVGIAGGLSNPVYYQKIMTYIQLKYYKRYLMKLVQ